MERGGRDDTETQQPMRRREDTTEAEERATADLNDRLKLWVSVLVGVLVTFLVLLDALDDLVLDDRYRGPPTWLYGLFCTMALTLAGSSVIDKIRRKGGTND